MTGISVEIMPRPRFTDFHNAHADLRNALEQRTAELNAADPQPPRKIAPDVEDVEAALAKFAPPTDLAIGQQSAKAVQDAAERHALAVEARAEALIEVVEGMMKMAQNAKEDAAHTARGIRASGANRSQEILRTAHEIYEWNQVMKAMARKHESPPVDEQKAEQAAAGIAESDDVAASRG